MQSRVEALEAWLRLGCVDGRLGAAVYTNGCSFQVPARSAVTPLPMRDLALAIAEQAEMAAKSFYRLVLVAGPPGSGKTSAFKELQAAKGWSLLNLSKSLSERLLDQTSKQRRLRTADIIRDLIEEQGDKSVSMLDNIGLLFHPALQQEPMMTLQRASRNHMVIAAWQGKFNAGKLIYGSPDHLEYRSVEVKDVQIVTASGHCLAGA